jgi:DNA-binding transcriptional ArsR family regulator
MDAVLDPIFLHEIRLKLMSRLLHQKEVDFIWIQKNTGFSSGNLSLQALKLKKAGYLEIRKRFKGNYPSTSFQITKQGKIALLSFFETVDSLKSLEQSIDAGVILPYGSGDQGSTTQ